jgi:hypothetical protein
VVSPFFIFGVQMEIQIKTEELRKKSLFVATPMYGGMNHGLYMKACLDLQGLCIQYGINIKFSFLFNESLITRARNYLVDEFLNRSDCTHMLFIDSDINFNPQDVIAMLALDKDIIGGPYPKKAIKWRAVKKAVQMHPDVEPGHLEKVAGDFVFNPVKGTAQFSVSEPLEVLEIGTGFMLIKREVFPVMEKAYPQLRYKPDHVGQQHFDGSRYIHAFFDTIIDTKDSATGGGSDRYLSEDYMFCQLWRKTGGQIWLCPWVRTQHIGTYHFQGDMPAVANYVGEM